MRTDLDTYRMDDDDDFVSDSDLIGFMRPSDIVHDPILTLTRKRQLLVYWASDIHAVVGAPALRSYAFETAVPIDDIKVALVELDEMIDLPAIRSSGETTAAA